MKLNRREFLKGLFATVGTIAVTGPQALIEPLHGASKLTSQERDIAAEVMGLRQKQWIVGWDNAAGKNRTVRIPILDGYWPDGTERWGQLEVPENHLDRTIAELNELRHLAVACKRGSLMMLDNLGISLHLPESGSMGRLMLNVFDQWTVEHKVNRQAAAIYRSEIEREYIGLPSGRPSMLLGYPIDWTT